MILLGSFTCARICENAGMQQEQEQDAALRSVKRMTLYTHSGKRSAWNMSSSWSCPIKKQIDYSQLTLLILISKQINSGTRDGTVRLPPLSHCSMRLSHRTMPCFK